MHKEGWNDKPNHLIAKDDYCKLFQDTFVAKASGFYKNCKRFYAKQNLGKTEEEIASAIQSSYIESLKYDTFLTLNHQVALWLVKLNVLNKKFSFI